MSKPLFQLGVVMDFNTKASLPVLRHVMGRLGTTIASGEWRIQSEDYFNKSSDERVKRHLAIFVPFMMLKLLGMGGEHGSPETFRAEDTKSVALARMFRAIGATLDSFHDLEMGYLKKEQKNVFYEEIRVFCAEAQRHSQNVLLKSGLLHALMGPSGIKNQKTGFYLKTQEICRPDDIFILDFRNVCELALDKGESVDDCLRTFNDKELEKWRPIIVADPRAITDCFLALASCGMEPAYTITDADRDELARLIGNKKTGRKETDWRIPYLWYLQDYLANRVREKSFQGLDIRRVYGLKVEGIDQTTRKPDGKHMPFASLPVEAPGRVVLVTGKSGAGKSTALRHFAWSVAADFLKQRKGIPLPIYLECSSAFSTQIVSFLAASGCDGLDANKAFDLLSKQHCLFLIDGFDSLEAPARNNPTELEQLKIRFPKERFIITCRSGQIGAFGQTQEYSVLEPENPAQCLVSHGIQDDIADRAISGLKILHAETVLTRPIFLGFVARILKDSPNADIPSAPGALMKRIVDDFYIPEMLRHNRMAKEYKLTADETDDFINGLAVLAFRMIDEDAINGFDADKCSAILTSFFESKKRGNPPGDLAHNLFYAVKFSGFLEETLQKTHAFKHAMFRDYFAACHILKHWGKSGCRAKELVEWLKWDNALTLLCGMADAEVKRDCISVAAENDIRFGEGLLKASGEDVGGPLGDFLLAQILPLAKESFFCTWSACRLIYIIQVPNWKAFIIAILCELERIATGKTEGDKETAVLSAYFIWDSLTQSNPELFNRDLPLFNDERLWIFREDIERLVNESRALVDQESLRNAERLLGEAGVAGKDAFGWLRHSKQCEVVPDESFDDFRKAWSEITCKFEESIEKDSLSIRVSNFIEGGNLDKRLALYYPTETTVRDLLKYAELSTRADTRVELSLALCFLEDALVLVSSGQLTNDWLYSGMRHICRCYKTIGTSLAKAHMIDTYHRIQTVSGRRLCGILPGFVTDLSDITTAVIDRTLGNLNHHYGILYLASIPRIIMHIFLVLVKLKAPDLANKYKSLNKIKYFIKFWSVSNANFFIVFLLCELAQIMASFKVSTNDYVGSRWEQVLLKQLEESVLIWQVFILGCYTRLVCPSYKRDDYFQETIQKIGVPPWLLKRAQRLKPRPGPGGAE